MYNSKMMIVIFPRERKMTKEQLVRQSAITSIMSLVSVGGVIEQGGGTVDLRFPMSTDPKVAGIPQNWFTGDSHFEVEVKRIIKASDYQLLYHWFKQKGVPVFQGEEDGEPTMMVVGPYWGKIIDEIFSLAIPLKKTVRPFATN